MGYYNSSGEYFEEIHEYREASRRWPKVFIALLVVGGFCGYFYRSRPLPTVNEPPGTSANAPARESPGMPGLLSINTSGRLPTRVRGVALGMSRAEMMALHPDLELSNQPSQASQYRLYMFSRQHPSSSDGGLTSMFEESNGRVVKMSSRIEGISPENAAAFERDVLNRLGPPDFSPAPLPEEQSHVWIDGDVRVRLQNSKFGQCHALSRVVELEIANWPAYVRLLNEDGDSAFFREKTMREWGDSTAAQVAQAQTPLPRSLGDLRLGMSLSEVLRTVPGLRTWASAHGRKVSGKRDRDGLEVAFWDGFLYSIDVTQVADTSEEFERSLLSWQQLLDGRYGTPFDYRKDRRTGYEFATWRDDATSFGFIGSPYKTSSTRRLMIHVLDRNSGRAELEEFCASQRPFGLKTPSVSSFFARDVSYSSGSLASMAELTSGRQPDPADDDSERPQGRSTVMRTMGDGTRIPEDWEFFEEPLRSAVREKRRLTDAEYQRMLQENYDRAIEMQEHDARRERLRMLGVDPDAHPVDPRSRPPYPGVIPRGWR